ncbi:MULTISPECIES: plasmid mobilization protein [Clostridia]|uniref:Plasmid mobilization relaxosome protein MobC n=1 Tax=Enterocloster asparagiformis TaxID=333367 RepID=A0A413FAQ2_9FIRM|nr:plasmid mobilization relaxosome protein MobC [Enterocloster asparagiformis]RGX25744.1 plasmid mobilization relaxosome protein MobC [Enterocloster asparagiformis]
MANRERNIQLHFMVTPRERQLIAEKMAQLGTKNLGAYLRKQAVDGYIVKLDLGSVRELVGLLRGATNNLNQIARRANETRSLYAADVEDMQARYAELWEAANKILLELAQIS